MTTTRQLVTGLILRAAALEGANSDSCDDVFEFGLVPDSEFSNPERAPLKGFQACSVYLKNHPNCTGAQQALDMVRKVKPVLNTIYELAVEKAVERLSFNLQIKGSPSISGEIQGEVWQWPENGQDLESDAHCHIVMKTGFTQVQHAKERRRFYRQHLFTNSIQVLRQQAS
jgi:hypothetical protein